jgi:hypothetical protein
MHRPTRTPRARRLAVAAVAVAATATVAGCGVTGGSGTGIEALALPAGASHLFVRDAAEQTAAATGQRVSAELVVRDAEGAVVLQTTAEGAFDEEAGVGELSTTTSAGGGLDGLDLDVDLVMDGTDVYVRAGMLEMFTGGTPWLRVPGEELDEVTDELGTTVTTDPTSFVELLEATAGPLEDLGTEAVRGVPTRHVAGTLDLEALAGEVAPERAEELAELLDELPDVAEDVSAIPVEAWIDGEGFVRRFTFTIDQLGEGDGQGSITQTVELWDFDEPLTVEVPPADQVQDLDASSLLGD